MADRFEFDPKQAEAVEFVWDILMALLVPLVLFALIGRWLDTRLDTSPWCLVASFPCAIAIAYRMIRRKAEVLQHDIYDDKKENKLEKEEVKTHHKDL